MTVSGREREEIIKRAIITSQFPRQVPAAVRSDAVPLIIHTHRTHTHKQRMHANFSLHLSKSSSRLAPTQPARRGSIETEKLARVVSVPITLAKAYDEFISIHPHNVVFPMRGCLQREKDASPLASIKPASSMVLDHASQQRTAATKLTLLYRADSSSDRIPAIPVRVASPVKVRQCSEQKNFSECQSNVVRVVGSVHHSTEDKDCPVIRKPEIKSNIFLQDMSSPTGFKTPFKSGNRVNNSVLKYRERLQPKAHIRANRAIENCANILDAAELGASELSDKHHLTSRWDSSSSLLYSVRPHESLSSSFEFFLNEKETQLPKEKKFSSTSCLMSRGLERSKQRRQQQYV